MSTWRVTFVGALAMATAIGGLPNLAAAENITTASSFTVDFSASPSAGVLASADAVFSNFVFATDSVTFNMDVTNTTSGTYTGDIRFTSLGWDTSPASTAATDTSSIYASTTNKKLGSTTVSVCLYGGSNCDGGSNGGLEDPLNFGLHGDPSTTGIFSVTIDFGSTTVPPLDFSDFIGKFQSANYSSFDATGCVVGVDCAVLPPPIIQGVPEPASMLLLGTGLVGLGALHRRRGAR